MDGLIDFLNDYLSPQEIVERLDYILRNDYWSKDILRQYAIDHNICPICYSELISNTYCEDRGEYFGFPVSEKIGILICKECGWEEN